MTGPSPKRSRTTRLVAEIMPLALVTSSGTAYCSTLKPSPSSSSAARLAWGAQSPGGLSEGTLTSSARNAVSAACFSRRKLAIFFPGRRCAFALLLSFKAASAPSLGFEIAQDVEKYAGAQVRILHGHGFSRVMTDAAVSATYEQHADVGHVGYRHTIMPCAAGEKARLDAFGADLLSDMLHDPRCARARMRVVLRGDHGLDLAAH